MIHWLCVFLVFSGCIFGGIEQYFKKAEGKTALPTMTNIDYIYLLNLDKRPEKYQSSVEQLKPYGINPYRFSAINGWEDLSLQDLNQLGVTLEPGMAQGNWGTCYLPDGDGKPYHEIVNHIGRNYFCHCMSMGAIACALSHLSILQDAYDSGYETIWVMEDDIEVLRNPHELSNLINLLDREVGRKKWDVLYTDTDTKNQKGEHVACTGFAWRPNYTPPDPTIFAARSKVGKYFKRVGARYGTYSMIIRRSGMKKILDFMKQHKIFLPIDMDLIFSPGIRLYTVVDDVVSTLSIAPSDNGAPNYGN